MNAEQKVLKLIRDNLLVLVEGIEEMLATPAPIEKGIESPVEKKKPTEEKKKPEPVKEEAPVEEKPKRRGRKPKSEEPAEEPVGEVEEIVDIVVAQVNKATKDMTNEEIAEVLVDIGVSAAGKREALIAKVVKAVKDGKLELDSADEDSEEEVVEEEMDSEFELNNLDNPDMTEERKKAVKIFIEESREDFENGELNREVLIGWLNEVNGTEETYDDVPDEEILNLYVNLSCLVIDDEGNTVDPEQPYTVNGIPYCCGSPLVHDEEEASYICNVCGEEYEAEE